MNNMFPRPRFWAEAAERIKPRRPVFSELLRYLLLSMIALLAQSVLISIPMSFWLLKNKGDELMAAFEAGELPQSLLLNLMKQMPDWLTVISLLSSAVIGVAAVFYCLKIQKRTLSSMGLCGKHRLAEGALGFVLGLALTAAALALGFAAGGYRLACSRPSGETLGLLLLALLGCAVYGASLELLTRGCLAPTLGAGLPVAAALVISTLASLMMQSGGELFSLATANELLLGLLLGIWVVKRGNLWSACGFHAAWLFAQSFLADVAPVDAHGSIHLFCVDADLYRPAVSGGELGPMGSIGVTIVLLLAVAAALALRPKDPAPPAREPTPEN